MKKQYEINVFRFNVNVLSPTSQNAWQEWDGAHTLTVTPSGGSILSVKQKCKVNAVPWHHGRYQRLRCELRIRNVARAHRERLLSSTVQNAWQEWDAAHVAR